MKALFDQTKKTKWYVEDDGSLFSIQGKKKIKKKGTLHKRGYVYVRTTNGNYQLHRLVASAFIPNPQNKPCVNHKDGNKQNNCIKNLEWCTYKENVSHALKNGLLNQLKKNEGGNLKYTNKQCKEVLQRVKEGMTYIEAGKKHNMPYSTVAHLVRGSRRLL